MSLIGKWRPARLTLKDQMFLTWVSLAFITVRSFDYLTGEDKPAPPPPGHKPRPTSLTIIEAALPVWLWGAVLLVGVALCAGGIRLKQHKAVWTGHMVLAFVGTVLAVSVILSVAGREWLDGIRSAGPLMFASLYHWLLWYRTGPTPLPENESTPSEILEEPK